jgi:hypothetical protein
MSDITLIPLATEAITAVGRARRNHNLTQLLRLTVKPAAALLADAREVYRTGPRQLSPFTP